MNNRERGRKSNIGWILGSIVLLAIIGVLVWMVLSGDEEPAPTPAESAVEEQNAGGRDIGGSSEYVEKWQEGVITYKGQGYRYNDDIKSYLFMGIDKDGTLEESEAENYIDGGQSDAMFLLVVDNETEQISIIAINRNTMAMIDVYDPDGVYLGRQRLQICLQHGYGDGRRVSCQYAADAVSRLFNNIPISGYLAMNMDGMISLTDSIGGIEVTVEEDFTSSNGTYSYKAGETVKLDGPAAYSFLRSRDTTVFDSAGQRLARQQLYIQSLMLKLQSLMSGSIGTAARVFKAIEPYTVTSLDVVQLAEDFYTYSFSAEEDMYSIPGEITKGETFEEYIIDDTALYDLIIQLFYEAVE